MPKQSVFPFPEREYFVSFPLLMLLQSTITLNTGDQGRYDFCVVFTMSLCAIKSQQNVNKLTISNHVALKLAIEALKSYLKLTCQYQFHILLNEKVSAAKDHGKNYMKVRLPLVQHL